MGKLVKCKTCGEEIAKNAKFCPKCGAKRKKHTVLGILLVIIGVFLFVGAFGAANSPDEGNPKSPQNQEETQTRDDSTQPDSTGIGDAYKSAIYMWEGEGSLGANANVTFQGGKVLSKAQMGLE